MHRYGESHKFTQRDFAAKHKIKASLSWYFPVLSNIEKRNDIALTDRFLWKPVREKLIRPAKQGSKLREHTCKMMRAFSIERSSDGKPSAFHWSCSLSLLRKRRRSKPEETISMNSNNRLSFPMAIKMRISNFASTFSFKIAWNLTQNFHFVLSRRVLKVRTRACW